MRNTTGATALGTRCGLPACCLLRSPWPRSSPIIFEPTHTPSLNPESHPQELLYNVVEAPEVGVHPRHFCIELDPETQSILAVGMGPRAKDTKGVALAATVTDRLKRRLRSKGFRASYTLQMVCEGLWGLGREGLPCVGAGYLVHCRLESSGRPSDTE